MYTSVPLLSVTGLEIPGSSQQSPALTEFLTATKFLCLLPEAYHLLITGMHAGAHRSVTLAFQQPESVDPADFAEPMHLLTDLFIPASPYLTSITVEALLSHKMTTPTGVCKDHTIGTRLLVVSTEIGRNPVVLRDMCPPVPFTKLRISVSARLDCKLSRARIHLGTYFGRSGSFSLPVDNPLREARSWEFAWATGKPLFCDSSSCINQNSAKITSSMLDYIERWKSSALASLYLTQSELVTWLAANNEFDAMKSLGK